MPSRKRPRPYGPVTLRSGGQLTPPVELRNDFGLKQGDRVYFFAWEGEKRVLMVFGEMTEDRLADQEFLEKGLHFPPER
jgi:bifunctional DNA-binding transcriptional regulator/antitoxin component of YhaV-PrlF toxin-antitoxin module